MRTSDFDFVLPKGLIAQEPLKKRVVSKMMVLDRKNKTIEHKHFYNIIDYLQEGDVLVRNNTKVIPARIFGTKEETGAHVEVLLLKQIQDEKWECLTGNARVIKLGTEITFSDTLKGTCVEVKEEGIRIIKFESDGVFLEELSKIGEMPLPPYIKKKLANDENYQTVYAKYNGSSAAPTAGLHFNDELIEQIKNKGITIVDVTLHIGLGTFKPVKVDDVKKHKMHTEEFIMNEETARILNTAKEEGRRIIAVGTTSTRVLETVMNKYNKFIATHEESDIFIYPGYKFKAVDCLITNFHLPKSTLLMLISAFAGKEYILDSYNEAVKEKYRFFSFGDSMFIK